MKAPVDLLRELKKEYEELDDNREKIIKKSREALKQAKKSIYAVHKKDFDSAEKHLENAKKIISELTDNQANNLTGSLREAQEEMVEAACFLSAVKKQNIPSPQELNVDIDCYLAGLCDCLGELTRYAINNAQDQELVEVIYEFITDTQTELLEFAFRNGSVRKKFDSIKYHVEKLEKVLYDAKLRQDIKVIRTTE